MPSSTPLDALNDRFQHPVIGPYLWSFLVWNWPLAVWLLGAVAHPSESFIGIEQWESSLRFLDFAVPFGVAGCFIVGGPFLATLYYRYDLFVTRQRLVARLRSEKIAPIPRKLFDDALQAIKERDLEYQRFAGKCAEARSYMQALYATNLSPLPDGQRDAIANLNRSLIALVPNAMFLESQAISYLQGQADQLGFKNQGDSVD